MIDDLPSDSDERARYIQREAEFIEAPIKYDEENDSEDI